MTPLRILSRRRRGSALLLVLMTTLAIAALSIAAVYMGSSAQLLAASHDIERTYRLAALSGVEMARDRLLNAGGSVDGFYAIPGAGTAEAPHELVAATQVRDAAGDLLPRVWVRVFAARTGGGEEGVLPTITVIAQACDASTCEGRAVRHVQRADLRPETFARFAMFVDGSVGGHGAAIVGGRAHSNGNWTVLAPGPQADNVYLDSLTVVGTLTPGGATFSRGSYSGTPTIPFPSTPGFDWRALAAAGNLNVNLTGANAALPSGARRGPSRLVLTPVDVDLNGSISVHEGFFMVLDLATERTGSNVRKDSVMQVMMEAAPGQVTSSQGGGGKVLRYYNPTDEVLLQQCGAFYLRQPPGAAARGWHFIPVTTHLRNSGTFGWIQSVDAADYPQVTSTQYATMTNGAGGNLAKAVQSILTQPTARCFPVGSPYLMPAERFNTSRTDDAWGGESTENYGGSDTTFTAVLRRCTAYTSNKPNQCANNAREVIGAWRAPPQAGAWPAASKPAHAVLRAFLWPVTELYNPTQSAARIVNVQLANATDSVYIEGRSRGRVTIRVEGQVRIPDRLTAVKDPNDLSEPLCADAFGLLAQGDILVTSGLPARLYQIDQKNDAWDLLGGGESYFALDGHFLSFGGSVGVRDFASDWGPNVQLSCPADERGKKDDSNGGCLQITGGIAMKTYRKFYDETQQANLSGVSGKMLTGMRHAGAGSRCAQSGGAPPYFPLTGRVFVMRSLEVGARRVDTEAEVGEYLETLLPDAP